MSCSSPPSLFQEMSSLTDFLLIVLRVRTSAFTEEYFQKQLYESHCCPVGPLHPQIENIQKKNSRKSQNEKLEFATHRQLFT